MRLEALRGSERRVVRIVGMVGLTLDETRIVSSRPDWPLRSLMPKGSLRVKKFKKPLIEPIEQNAALKKGQGLTLNEPENRLKETPNELVKKLKKKDYTLRKRLECV